jgi:transcriptional antiterminator RfaH
MRAWYICQTKSREEQSAEVNLRKQGYETYLPQALTDRRIKKNKFKTTEPLFPGYLFVSLSDETDDWRPIQSTRGVICLVKFGDIPAPCPAHIIQILREAENEQGINQAFRTEYRKGDMVRMLNKPFEFMEAVIDTVANERIFLILDIITNQSRVEVGYRDIEPIDT